MYMCELVCLSIVVSVPLIPTLWVHYKPYKWPLIFLTLREGNAGLQPGMVLEDLLGGHQPSVSPVHHLQFFDEPAPATAFPIQLSPLERHLGLLHRDVVCLLHPHIHHLSADQHFRDT